MDIRAIPKKVEEAVDRLKATPPAILRRGPEDLAKPTRSDEAQHKGINEPLLLHMLATYRQLRRGMGWLAIVYPFALVALGHFFFNAAWQPSISDYYYALPRGLDLPNACLAGTPAVTCANGWSAKAVEMSFPLRSFFCGGLLAIGFFLILYKGTSWLEDWALNLAGLFAIGVAVFPMNKVPFTTFWPTWWHFVSAILLFVCMWFISRFCAKDTLQYFELGSPEVPRYEKRYKHLSWAMLGVLVAGLVYFLAMKTLDALFPWTLFVIEAAGVVVFGSYWVIKSKEISKHEFGRKAG